MYPPPSSMCEPNGEPMMYDLITKTKLKDKILEFDTFWYFYVYEDSTGSSAQ